MRGLTGLLTMLLISSGCAPSVWRLKTDPAPALLIQPGRGAAGRTLAEDHFRVYGEYERDAQVNLLAGMRVKVTAPLLAPGEDLRTDARIPTQPGAIEVRTNVTGYQTAYYTVLEDGRWREAGTPTAARIEIPRGLTSVRLLFQRRLSRDDRSIALIAATSPGGLDEAGATPITVARGVAVSPEIAIAVNGAERWVALGARVSSVLPKPPPLETLQMRRLYRGKPTPVQFERSSRAILGMPLNGGDELLWTH
ncbi:MAG: hypothetical protein R2762_24240 [Bryobacteraceae bacterium]